tara:strand:+ start:3769 stop:4566 length:798 start_codon:yes stop_codon:yes gene_type:complete
MNFFEKNCAILDLKYSFKSFPSWSYLAYFDLKLKYRKTYLGPWWVVVGMAISAGILCLLWSTIFNLDWRNFLLYLFSGFIIWTWLISIINDGPEIFYANASLVKAYPVPPIFHALRKSYLNFLLFIHHLPLIFLLVFIMQPEINIRVFITLPIAIFLIFTNSVLYSATIGIISSRYRDVEPTIKALMAPMLLLTPVLWKPEMLGEYIYYIYFNPFTYFIGIVRNDLIGSDFNAYIWYGAFIITFLQLLIFIVIYSAKRNRIVFWV